MLAAVQAAQDSIEANSSWQGPVAAPTMLVDTIAATAATRPTRSTPTHSSDERPSWSKLPSSRADARVDERPVPGRRRAVPAGRTVSARTGGIAGSPAAVWFGQFMSRPNGRRTFYATLAVLALLISLTGWYFGFGRYTSAPSVVGQTKAQAVALATKDGFKVQYTAAAFSPTVKDGSVLKQSPSANGKIRKNGVLTLTLSKGPERYALPNEVGSQYDLAFQDLTTKIKMKVQRVDAYDNDNPPGIVIKMDPAAGTVQYPNTVVTVTVSKGRAPITVPNVVGHDYNEANATLTGLGLQVAEIQKQSATVLLNQVISQSLPDGTGATKNEQITLTVSSGPPVVPVPNVSNLGYNLQQAQQVLQQAGFVVVEVFDFPGGQVRNQNPAFGQNAPQGSTVQIWMGP